MAACTAAGALAQDGGDPVRAEQAALYRQLLADPDDPALMLEYVRVSQALEDNEAVISTLERALIYSPGDPAILIELGAAYFRLGSYAVARLYFGQARERVAVPVVQERIDEFIAAIDARGARSRFSGLAMAGAVLSTNANLGVDNRTLRFLGADVLADADFEAESGAGRRFIGQLTHVYDLGRPTLDVWRTELGVYSLNYFSEDAGDVDGFSATTGPSLALGAAAYGQTLRPFAGFRAARSAGAPLFVEYGAGVEGTAALDGAYSLFGVAGAGYRDYAGDDREGFDGATARGLAGISYAPTRRAALFASVVADADDARDPWRSNAAAGLRLAGVLQYDPGFDAVDGLWRLTAYAQAQRRDYDEADPLVDPDTVRRDVDLRLGIAHLFRVQDGLGLQVDVDYVRQNSNIANYDVNSLTGAVSVVLEF